MDEQTHAKRLALVLALAVVALVVVSIDHFRSQGNQQQTAAVLRAYDK